MRSFTETTARNLLRKPLVLGVPVQGLVALGFGTISLSVVAGRSVLGNAIAAGISAVAYMALRLFAKFARSGWEESLFFPLEKAFGRKEANAALLITESSVEIVPPETLEDTDLIAVKESLAERLKDLRPDERLAFVCEITNEGAKLREVAVTGSFSLKRATIQELSGGLIQDDDCLYSLHRLPVTTDPLWFYSILSGITGEVRVFLSARGTDFAQMKRRIEVSRRGNFHGSAGLSNVDADISFEDADQVLRGLARGDEKIVEISLVLACRSRQELDEGVFCCEKNRLLSVASILGVRRRFHRSHFVRLATASDLVPNIFDPIEPGAAILCTKGGRPLYFSPQDQRLEALHWLVVGASGSGKSFFVGVILRRMLRERTPMAVLFVDHNRSFKRLVRSENGSYLEPKSLSDIRRDGGSVFAGLNRSGTVCGIELSDLNLDEKKAAAHAVLSGIEAFLRRRETAHPVYVVLDECWNFMRDEPVLVQRAFREFRKLNGAAIAITQSLSDFLSDQSGQSIFQNAPIRILLRQGEDVTRYQGILGLNSVELAKVRLLKQRKGVFSESLIKTPFLSRLGRLYPTQEEHDLLRTDNLRAEMVAEAMARRDQCVDRA